ncbi:MAG: hypothetical protein QOE59_1800 [Actinomycetota bacterium]|jgi:hypothetical protein|nr:hypothetical protein [Actinomycetota bacterium]
MVILGFALRISGFAFKVAAMAVAPVVAVLAWGALEDEMDKRKNRTAEAGMGS